MAHKIILPKQGLVMTEGFITKWLVQEGGQVKEGEPLFEMETDKLTITMDATASGTLLKILHPAGDVVPVAEVIAIVGEPGEVVEEISAAPAIVQEEPIKKETEPPKRHTGSDTQAACGMRMQATPRAVMRAEEMRCDLKALTGTGPDGLIIERDVLQAPKLAATPLARRIAQQEGVSLASLEAARAARSRRTMYAEAYLLRLSRMKRFIFPCAACERLLPKICMRAFRPWRRRLYACRWI